MTIEVRTASQLADLIPPLWVKKIRSDVALKEFFGKMAGPEGSQSAIIEKTDFQKQPGDTLTFLVESELYGTGRVDEEVLMGNEERPTTHQFGVPVRQIRHAEGVTHMAQQTAMVDSIVRAGGRLARWLARKRDEVVFSELLSPGSTNLGTINQSYTTVAAPTPKTLYGGSATSIATLSNTCRFSLDEIDKGKLALIRMGTLPIEVRSSKTGQELQYYVCIIDEMSAFRLFSSTQFRNAVQAMLPRSFDHPLVQGALGVWNGVILHTYSSISQGCRQGTALRPECALTGTFRSGGTVLTVGAADGKDYTKNFPASGTLTVNRAGTTHQEAYTGKTANTFTGLTYSRNYEIGDLVTGENDHATCIFMGAEAMARAWAERDTPITDARDYANKLGVGIRGIWGNRCIQDSTGAAVNHLLLKVFADSPNPLV